MLLAKSYKIADGPSLFASHKDLAQLTGRPPRKNSTTGGTPNDNGNEIPQSFDDKLSSSSSQEEIIALFRRIKSSISKGDSRSSKKRSSKSSEDKHSAESVLDVLRQSREQVKERASTKGRVMASPRRKGPSESQEKLDHPSVPDHKLTRPPSNFVKRSPIPSPSSLRGKEELKSTASLSPAGDKEPGLQKVEEMKLPALKELAKSRGIKGYSKLKKSELVELLRT
ncbi:unnamed protein product [Ilex paraguariensis]|uniref:Rho termination factor-like N-terminal domain-containing protein n=1 Tax=Ilex paraguariensis TaxID=185542 RepID=A0ABC8RSZ4_9AQUA